MADTGDFIAALNAVLAGGDATEHSYRPAMKAWIESFDSKLGATNEPKQSENNAPDFDIKVMRKHGWLSIGKIEAKAPGKSGALQSAETDSDRAVPRTSNGEQLKRYRKAFSNLIYSDNIEFRWYKNGERKLTAALGAIVDGAVDQRDSGPGEVEALVEAFLAQNPQSVTTARRLAERLAAMAAIIRDVINQSMKSGAASDTSIGLRDAFRDTLVPDLTDDQFADMMAQTIAYGLFAARVQHHGSNEFTRHAAAGLVPKTNPFLRGLFTHITGGTLDDEPYAGVVDDIAQLLNDTDIKKVLKNFGQLKRDPIVHFYETFLTSYDPDLRDVRGVYYTPVAVVDFIVESVDEVLKSTFNLSDGLSDTTRTSEGQHRVIVLDPATGTGTFLYSAISKIRKNFINSGREALWSSYVSEHILPRFFGFELMVAPYAVAHLKLALQLAGNDLPEEDRSDIAYDFEKDERIGVYLTNALEPGEAHTTLPLGKFISDEANAASSVKTDKPIMVVFGNPPYQGESANASTRREFWRTVKGKRQYKTVKTAIGELLESYYSVDGEPLGERNSKWLQDDYVKFIRLGQARIEETGSGVLAYVTNHSYLDSPTFRGMRKSLLNTFDDIYVIDLHGSLRRSEKNPDGGADENAFDGIQQGVAVTLFVKREDSNGGATVHYMDLWGTRAHKYQWLESSVLSDLKWKDFVPSSPFFGFRPEDPASRAEWDACVSITDIFPLHSGGIVTSRDGLVIDTRKQRLVERIDKVADLNVPTSQVRRELFGTKSRTTRKGEVYAAGDNRDWKLEDRRQAISNDPKRSRAYRDITYRPFDDRHIFYHREAVDNMHAEVMDYMLPSDNFLEGNIGLVSARSNKTATHDHFFVSRFMTEAKTGEASTQSRLFPLWKYEEESSGQAEQQQGALDLSGGAEGGSPKRTANLGSTVVKWVHDCLGMKLLEDDTYGDLVTSVGPGDVLSYVYAVVHSRHYRIRYGSFMRQDFAKIPLTADVDVFSFLVSRGRDLIKLHTLSDSNLGSGIVSSPASGTNQLDKIRVSERWVDGGSDGAGHIVLNLDGGKNGDPQILPGVPREVWEYQVGGHPVLHKWLDSRTGDGKLTYDELMHLVKTVNAIGRTLLIQDELDETLTNWPLVDPLLAPNATEEPEAENASGDE